MWRFLHSLRLLLPTHRCVSKAAGRADKSPWRALPRSSFTGGAAREYQKSHEQQRIQSPWGVSLPSHVAKASFCSRFCRSSHCTCSSCCFPWSHAHSACCSVTCTYVAGWEGGHYSNHRHLPKGSSEAHNTHPLGDPVYWPCGTFNQQDSTDEPLST